MKFLIRNIFKIKKKRIAIFFLLIINQFLLNSYAVTSSKINLDDSVRKKTQTNSDFLKVILAEKKQNKNKANKQETEKIEEFVEEILDTDDFEKLQNQIPHMNNNFDELDKESISNEMETNKTLKKKKLLIAIQKLKEKRKNNLNNEQTNKLPLPASSNISTSEFKVPSKGYVRLKGPKISLNLQGADSIEALKTISKLGNYGIIIIEDGDINERENLTKPRINADFVEVDISDVFNSILLSAGLQAVVENNIIFVGEIF